MKSFRSFIPLSLLLLCFAALSTLLYLTHHYFDLKMGTTSDNSLCHINELFNCNVISASSYAELFSVPTALWGFVSYLLLFGLLIVAYLKLSPVSEFLYRMAFWLSGFHLLFSFAMAGISFFLLRHLCPFCILIYVLSFLIFVLGILWNGESSLQKLMQDLAFLLEKRKRLGFFLLLLLSVPAMAFIGSDMIFKNKMKARGFHLQSSLQESLLEWQASSVFEFDPHFGLIKKGEGKDKSKVAFTIVEFVDPLCPHCKAAHPALNSFASSRSDVQLLLKFFPLDGACNKNISFRRSNSCLLTQSVYCAEKLHKKGWKLHHWIFENQKKLSRDFDKEKMLLQISQELHLSHKNLAQCIEDKGYQDWIQKQIKEGERAGVQGTPTIYINGKKLPYGQNLYILKALYEQITKNPSKNNL